MIDPNGKIQISYKSLCDVVDELRKDLGPTHKTVIKLEEIKKSEENCRFLSEIIWHLITGKQTEKPITNGSIAELIWHAFPGMDAEFPYEMSAVCSYVSPLLKLQFPDFEKYSNENDLEGSVNLTVNVPVIKNMVGVKWRK